MSQHIKASQKVKLHTKTNQSSLNITDVIEPQIMPSHHPHPVTIRNMEDALYISRNHHKPADTVLKPIVRIKSEAVSANATINKSIDYQKIKADTQRQKEKTEFLKVFKIKQNAVSKILSKTYCNMVKQEQPKVTKALVVRLREKVPLKARIAFLDYKSSTSRSMRNLNSDIDCVRRHILKSAKPVVQHTGRKKKCMLYTHYINPQVVPSKIAESREHILKELSAMQKMASSKLKVFKI